jgi:hypothetical protein
MLLIWLPFIAAGTAGDAFTALRQTIGLMPALSINAHNLWFLATLGAIQQPDTQALVGPITGRMLGMLAFGLTYIWALFTLRSRRDFSLWLTASFIGVAAFMLLTQMHENYFFAAVTLLTVAATQSKGVRILLVIVSFTALANMALHDPYTDLIGYLNAITPLVVPPLRLGNSALNALVFLALTWTLGQHRWASHGTSGANSIAEFESPI